MITIVYLASLASLAHSGLITHDLGGGGGVDGDGGDYNHDKATSYQNIHMEHFHAVPTYVKKEYKHLLEHPISVGKSSSKVEIHHGGKHDHGYAIVNTKNNARGSGSGDEGAGYTGHASTSFGGHEEAGVGGDEGASLGGHGGASLGGHEAAQALDNAALTHGTSGYQVHDQQQDLLQHQSHEGLQLQAAAGLSQGFGHGGAGHYQASFAQEDHQGYEAALAALHLQHGGHGHS